MIFITKDTPLPPFIQFPWFIMRCEYSMNAKFVYALLYNRTMLSLKSGWVSEDGRAYVIYTIKQLSDDLGLLTKWGQSDHGEEKSKKKDAPGRQLIARIIRLRFKAVAERRQWSSAAPKPRRKTRVKL